MFDSNSGIGQFTLSRQGENLPVNPQLTCIAQSGDWVLRTHPSLGVTDLRAQDGTWIGWLLGLPIHTAEERLVAGSETFPIRGDRPDPGDFERTLYTYGGRFIAVVLTPSYQRIYLDAMGSLGCWYSESRRVVGSMPERLSDRIDWDSTFGQRLWKTRIVSGNWYPGGLCPDPDLMALLPNHYLDLESWDVRRHWPLPDSQLLNTALPVRQILEESDRIIQAHINALAKHYKLGLPLTGGQDCRSLLACGREHAKDIRLFVEANADTPPYDLEVPDALSRVMGLTFQVNPPVRDWQITLSGLGGEIARSFFWGPYWRRLPHLEPRLLMQRLQFERCDDRVDQRIADWKRQVPSMRPQDELDLLYLEHRLGTCFASVLYSKDAQGAIAIVPMNHRRLYEMFRCLPLSYRAARKFNKDLIELKWPELSCVPYNSLSFQGRERYIRALHMMTNSQMTAEQRVLIRPFLKETRSIKRLVRETVTAVPAGMLSGARILKHLIVP